MTDPLFEKKIDLTAPQRPPSERVPYISENWIFNDPFHKKLPVLVILVPVMIRPSGSGSFFEDIGL